MPSQKNLAPDHASIASLQQNFLNHIYDPSLNDLSWIATHPKDKLTPQQKLDIYRQSICCRLAKALQNIFPLTAKLGPEQFFAEICLKFAHSKICTSTNYLQYAQEFLSALPNYLSCEQAYWLELANLELAWERAYSGPSVPELDPQQLLNLAQLMPQNLILLPQPLLFLVHAQHDIRSLWRQLRKKSPPRQITPLVKEQYLLVLRRGEFIYLYEIEADLWNFLQELQEPCSLLALCEQITARPRAADVTSLLPKAIQSAWIKFEIISN